MKNLCYNSCMNKKQHNNKYYIKLLYNKIITKISKCNLVKHERLKVYE